jgi:hypothetical protein
MPEQEFGLNELFYSNGLKGILKVKLCYNILVISVD